MDFHRFWEAWGGRKIDKKSKKSSSGRFRSAFVIRYRFWNDFVLILTRFVDDFLKIFDQMLLNFGLLRHALG